MAESSVRSTEPRQRLGRGLAALLGEAKPAEANAESYQGARQVPVEFLRASARNPRQTFGEIELDELAGSIKEHGIIQPIIVRPISETKDAFEIVAGERRWRAAQRAGLHTVPIISLAISDREALEFSIVENVQRADLNALEEARGYAQLASEYGYSHADVGRIVGKSRSHVANTLRLMSLPLHSRELLSKGALTAGHARALLSLPDPDATADRIIAQGLTVRDVENLHGGAPAPKGRATERAELDADTLDLQERLATSLGVTVEIRKGKGGYRLGIQTKDLEQLQFICTKILGAG